MSAIGTSDRAMRQVASALADLLALPRTRVRSGASRKQNGSFIVQLGFLDGMEGLAIAYMAALYNFLKYSKARFMSPHR